jgi:peptidoglycan/LPS O-acetylase OafA/YrhL
VTKDKFAEDLQARLSLSQIPALNGIRAIAVFLVIFYHFGLRLFGVPVPGAHGVLLFFVLSGFLITWLLLRENEKFGEVSLSGFYRRRILRIFPAFYFYWIVLLVILAVGHQHIPWSHAISSLLYVGNYYNAIFGDPNNALSHTWSLAIEEQFYLFWPFLFVVFRRDLKKMTILIGGLIGTIWIYRCVLYFIFNVDQAYFYAAFDTRLDSLMVGCLLAVLLKRGSLMTFWEGACRNVVMPALTIALLLISVFGGPAIFPRYRDVVGLAVDPVLMAIIIVQMIALSSMPYFQWLEHPVVRFLGQISYSLYLYQQLTVSVVSDRLHGEPLMVRLIAAVAVTIIAASFSYYVIERPFLKLKAKRVRPKVIEPIPGNVPALEGLPQQ